MSVSDDGGNGSGCDYDGNDDDTDDYVYDQL